MFLSQRWLIVGVSLVALLLLAILLTRFLVQPLLSNIGGTSTVASPAQVNTALPVVTQTTVYIANGNNVYAFQHSTGVHLRTYTIGNQDSRIQSLAPTVVNGVMYLPVGDFAASNPQPSYALYAVRLSDGVTLWHRTLRYTSLFPLVVIGGTLYVGDTNHTLYALRTTDGAVLWQHQGMNEDLYGAAKVGDTLYVESTANRVYALNASTGSTRWQHQFDTKELSELVLTDTMLFVGTDNVLNALNVSNGTLLWSKQYQSQVGNPMVAQGVVYVSTADGVLHALQASDGRQHWQKQTGDVMTLAVPLYANGTLYVSTQRKVNTSTDQGSTLDGYVVALKAADGMILWVYDVGEMTVPSPAVGNGLVYVVLKRNILYALQADTGQVSWQTSILS